ncbi:hypothetical protein [Catenulispora subtropica]|uniref:Uncharacterized protein n=1 Tax=Catenulispora subtropica TaxID=450798 RepID=A0ABP5DSI3_9ACTN
MSDPVLLVLDYPGRRPEARVSDLGLEDAGYDVRYLMQPPLPCGPSAVEYTAEALAAAGPQQGGAHAVLAYCGASALGQEVALRVGCPRLLLFNGELCTPQVVGTEYRLLLESVAGEPVGLPSWWHTDLLADRSDDFLKRCEAHLIEQVRRSIADAADGEPDDQDLLDAEDAMAPLLDGFLDWLAYLAASHRTDHPAFDADVVSFLSRDQPAVEPWPGARTTVSVRIDTTRDDLLADPATRRLVLDTLAAPFDGGSR